MKELHIGSLEELSFDVEENLNQLRVNLGFCGSNIKTIMLTSSIPNEGKSFVAFNLWRLMAGVGLKVLLVDADLRNSEMRSAHQITTDDGRLQGIAYYLSGQIELEDAIYKTNIENAYLMPMASAIANPTILLENGRFEAMTKACSGDFDYIIVDTPPLGSVADALNISRYCDGTVLVIRSGETPRKIVENSLQLLHRTETPLLGVVLNRIETTRSSQQYYYRYGYGYGYGAYGHSKAITHQTESAKE